MKIIKLKGDFAYLSSPGKKKIDFPHSFHPKSPTYLNADVWRLGCVNVKSFFVDRQRQTIGFGVDSLTMNWAKVKSERERPRERNGGCNPSCLVCINNSWINETIFKSSLWPIVVLAYRRLLVHVQLEILWQTQKCRSASHRFCWCMIINTQWRNRIECTKH